MRRRRRGPLSSVLLVAGCIALGMWALYLVVANWVLSSWLEHRLSRQPETQRLELGSAWTIWPGRVHVRGFRFRHAEEDLQLELGFERATLDVELFSLAERVLHVRSLDADGTTFRFRRLLDDPGAQPLRVRALPTFDGLPVEPRAQAEEEEDGGDPSRLWSLRIEGIEASVRELWVDEFRYEGSGRITGAFWFAPDRELEIYDSRVTLGPAPLGFGRIEPIAQRIQGTIEGRVRRLDVSDDAPGGWGVFRQFTLHGELDAEVASLGWTRAYLPNGTALEQGNGPLSVALHLDDGKFTPESRVRFRTADLRLRRGDRVARGDADLSLGVTSGEGRLALRGERIAVSRLGAIEGLELALRGDALDLAEPWTMTSGRASVDRVRVPDLSELGNGGKLRFHGGALDGRARATLDRFGRVRGSLALNGRGVQASIGELRVHGTGRAETSFAQPRLGKSAASLSDAELELAHFSFATPHGASGPGSLTASARRVELAGGRPRRFEVDFKAAFGEAEGVMDALEIADTGLARLGRAFVDLEDLRVQGSVRRDARGLLVRLSRARTDGVSVSGAIAPREPARGRFAIDLGLIEFDVEVEP